jgi:hypothetical protein
MSGQYERFRALAASSPVSNAIERSSPYCWTACQAVPLLDAHAPRRIMPTLLLCWLVSLARCLIGVASGARPPSPPQRTPAVNLHRSTSPGAGSGCPPPPTSPAAVAAQASDPTTRCSASG